MSYKEELLSKTKAELTAIALEYELNVAKKNKNEIVDEIIRFEAGVPAETVIEDVVEVKPKKQTEELTLVKFIGQNPTFQVGKHTFGADHPFVAVPVSAANHVYRTWPRLFRPATPDEVSSYYN